MDAQQIQHIHVLSTAAANYEQVQSCLTKVDNRTLLHMLHQGCTDALQMIEPASACQSRTEAQYFAAAAKVAGMLLEGLQPGASNPQSCVLDRVKGTGRSAAAQENAKSYIQALHTSSCKGFWQITIDDMGVTEHLVRQASQLRSEDKL